MAPGMEQYFLSEAYGVRVLNNALLLTCDAHRYAGIERAFIRRDVLAQGKFEPLLARIRRQQPAL